MIRPACTEDADSIALIHRAAFPGYFLTLMGDSFLVAFYRALIHARTALVLVDQDEASAVTGFVAGSIAGGRLGRILLSSPRVLIATFIAGAQRPHLWRALITRPRRLARADNRDGVANIWSIGVLPPMQGAGVGGRLLQRFEDLCRMAGVSKVSLTTEAGNGNRALGFYKRAGYSSVGIWNESTRALIEYEKQLRDPVE